MIKKILFLPLVLYCAACCPDEEGIPIPVESIILTGREYNRWLKSETGSVDRFEEVIFNDSLHLSIHSFEFRDSAFTDTLNEEIYHYRYRLVAGTHIIETATVSAQSYKESFQYYGDSLYRLDDKYYNIPLKRSR